MLQFLATDILMLAVGTLLYLAVRALPRLSDDEVALPKRTAIERFIMSEIPERADRLLHSMLGKFYRKLKIFLMRVDNALTHQLKKMHLSQNGTGLTGTVKPKIDFKDITEDKVAKEEEVKLE